MLVLYVQGSCVWKTCSRSAILQRALDFLKCYIFIMSGWREEISNDRRVLKLHLERKALELEEARVDLEFYSVIRAKREMEGRLDLEKRRYEFNIAL